MTVEPTTLPQNSVLERTTLPPNTVLCRLQGNRGWQVVAGAIAHISAPPNTARYRVLKAIGSGGFGTTYLALDTQQSERRHCVIKQLQTPDLPCDLAQTGAVSPSLSVEADLLSQLGQHPQIPALLNSFEADGSLYIVQEYIRGRSLKQEFVEGQWLSEAQAIDLLEQLSNVLMFVHNRGVIHRDIKPANIIRADVDGRLFLIDFGAVQQLDGRWGQPNTVIGSRGYAAPEQMEGYPKLNSDLYALGIVAIAALTGIPAYQLHSGSAVGPVPLDDFPIGPGLAQILKKLVVCDYRYRYQLAADVLADLKALMQ
ncbi:serine/threonine-protein kinase [Synechococcus sp. PCC 7336]|uniref:serine/threonine-protein kinase n=1 Tax=Synechococcus sp. PCC 7336 TaxID=195250 RepID=UPI0006842247|nr:serine/threonine-protein kinase [Synechococcus sp. PCC 7336]